MFSSKLKKTNPSRYHRFLWKIDEHRVHEPSEQARVFFHLKYVSRWLNKLLTKSNSKFPFGTSFPACKNTICSVNNNSAVKLIFLIRGFLFYIWIIFEETPVPLRFCLMIAMIASHTGEWDRSGLRVMLVFLLILQLFEGVQEGTNT